MSGPVNWTDTDKHAQRGRWNMSYPWNITSTAVGTSLMDESEETSGDGPLIFSQSLLLSFTVSFALLVTVGLLGNTVVIFALFRTRAHRATTTNAYILNLSIADLLFLLFCVPFQGTVYILNDWPYGDFMCKATHFCQYWTMYASIWLLTVMSVDRYLAIGHPLKSVDWRSPDQAMRICCCVWIASALLSIPWWILYRTETYVKSSGGIVTACFDFWGRYMYDYRKWLFLFVFLTGFVLPSCIIFFMAVLVARSIRNAVEQPLFMDNGSRGSVRRSYSGLGHRGGMVSKRRRRVVWLVFGLALTFFLCWLPQNASFMWLNFYKDIANSFQRHYVIYFIIKVASHMLTYVNSSVNPVLYSLASGRFRSRLAHALFMKNAAAFNNRANGSRPRSATANRNATSNCSGGRELKCAAIRADGRGIILQPLLRGHTNGTTCSYRRTTESDFASTTPSRTSSWIGASPLFGLGSIATDENRLSPRTFRPRHLSDITSANPVDREDPVFGKPTPLHRKAAMNRQRALTWSPTPQDNAAENNIEHSAISESRIVTEEKPPEAIKKPWRKRFPLFWRS